MTAYNLNTNSTTPKYFPFGDYTVYCTIPLTTAGTGDTYVLPIQSSTQSVYVLDAIIDSDAVDTGSTVIMSLGDATNGARFISGATSGQTGGKPQYLNVRGGLGFNYTTVTPLVLTISTGSGTFASGNVRVAVKFGADIKQGGG